jgi:hypothetical protein
MNRFEPVEVAVGSRLRIADALLDLVKSTFGEVAKGNAAVDPNSGK